MDGLGFPAPLASVAARFQAVAASWPNADVMDGDGEFDEWALEIHDAQRTAYPVLAAFWKGRGVDDPGHWSDVPPVPCRAFRTGLFGPREAGAVFRTSGTASGGADRGVHRVASLALYRVAARGNYRRHLLPLGDRGSGKGNLELLSLVPNPVDVPESSLASMAGFIAEEAEVEGVVWAFDVGTGVDLGACREALGGSSPKLVLATTFALAHLIEETRGETWRLPEGSVVMETGGFKGKLGEVDRTVLHDSLRTRLGIPGHSIVGEYGMTELLSQAYDAVAGRGEAPSERSFRFPPWVRVRVLDPSTLTPVPQGRPGLLAIYDLACLGSVCHVLTEDLGAELEDGGFRLLGRASEAEARGCSLMAEAFLASVGRSDSVTRSSGR